MVENPTNIKDKNERRDVRRNTSNQIVSYTLPTNSVQQYGLVKLPAIKEELNKEQFERVINTNVTEFQFNIPDTNLELISLNDIFFPEKVITDTPSLLEPLIEKYNSRYTPDFNSNNGLYEIPPGYTRDYYPIKLPFDKVIRGQSQDVEAGTFLITQELKDSGYDLLLKYRVTAEYRGVGSGSSFHTMFDFDNADGIKSPKIVTTSPKLQKIVDIGYTIQTILTPVRGDTSIPIGSDTNLTFNRKVNEGVYRVTNSEMRVFDRWQVKSLVGSENTQLIADGSYFDIEIVESDTQTPAEIEFLERQAAQLEAARRRTRIQNQIAAARVILNGLNNQLNQLLAQIDSTRNAYNYWVYETDRRQRLYDGTSKRWSSIKRAARRIERDSARAQRDALGAQLNGLISQRNGIQSQIDSQNSLIDELTKSLSV